MIDQVHAHIYIRTKDADSVLYVKEIIDRIIQNIC